MRLNDATPEQWDEAARQAEMTAWFPPEIKPVHIGEYNASCLRNPFIRRWWNGSYWSVDYRSDHPEELKMKCRTERTLTTGIEWRGLKEPK